MFDIGMTELLVIGVVALIVVGPKDLPGMFRTLGRFTGKMKGMAREFSRAMNDAADDAGVKDVASTLKSATSPSKMGLDRLNDAVDKFEKWTPGKPAKGTPPPKGDAALDEDPNADAASKATAKGPETQALSEERAETAKKIHEMTAKREADKAAVEADKPKTAPTLAPAPKPKGPPSSASKADTPAEPSDPEKGGEA